jgi:hypothetical protein
MLDAAITELSASGQNPKPGYYATRYNSDPVFAERERARYKAKYHRMPEDEKAQLIAKRIEKYKASPEIQARQRQTSREYYHKKKTAIQVESSKDSLVFEKVGD